MKYRSTVAITLALIGTALPLMAQSKFDRDLALLQEQQTKALAAATEPVNRRYQTALQSLLRSATQAKDLEAVNKINDELAKLGVSSPAAAETSGVTTDSVTKRLIGTKWYWFDRETITFLADGKAQWKESPVLWPWKVTSAGRRVIEGENKNNGHKFRITFDRDLKSGTVEGDGGTRKLQPVAP